MSMTAREALKILELDAAASEKDIKEAYRDMAMVWHPDRFANNPRQRAKAEKKMKRIIEAYEILQDYRPSRQSEPGRTREGADSGLADVAVGETPERGQREKEERRSKREREIRASLKAGAYSAIAGIVLAMAAGEALYRGGSSDRPLFPVVTMVIGALVGLGGGVPGSIIGALIGAAVGLFIHWPAAGIVGLIADSIGIPWNAARILLPVLLIIGGAAVGWLQAALKQRGGSR